jgi:hypothetical protein
MVELRGIYTFYVELHEKNSSEFRTNY